MFNFGTPGKPKAQQFTMFGSDFDGLFAEQIRQQDAIDDENRRRAAELIKSLEPKKED